MYPDFGPYIDFKRLALMGFNYQYLIFNLFSSPNSSIRFIAMAFGLVGAILILLNPKYQSVKVMLPYFILLFILLIGPYGSRVFFDEVDTAHYLSSCIVLDPSLTEEQAAQLNITGPIPAMAQCTGQDRILVEMGNLGIGVTNMQGYQPQMLAIDVLSKIERAVYQDILGGIDDIAALRSRMRVGRTVPAIETNNVKFDKATFAHFCPQFSHLAGQMFNVGEYNRVDNNMYSKLFTLEQVHQHNLMYYDNQEAAASAGIKPARAESIIPINQSWFSYTPEQINTQLENDIDQWSKNNGFVPKLIDLRAFQSRCDMRGSSLTIASPCSGSAGTEAYQLYYGPINENQAKKAREEWAEGQRQRWNKVVYEEIKARSNRTNQGRLPFFLYCEGAANGQNPEHTRCWDDQRNNSFSAGNNYEQYKRQIAKYAVNASNPQGPINWGGLPVAVVNPDPNLNGSYEEGNRAANCAELHQTTMQRQGRETLAQRYDLKEAVERTLTEPKIKEMTIDMSKGEKSKLIFDIIQALEQWIRDRPTPPTQEEISQKALEFAFGHVNPQTSSTADDLSGLANQGALAGPIAKILKGISTALIYGLQYFVGVFIDIFLAFWLAFVSYGTTFVLMVTPIVYLMGLLIPAWSFNILLAPIIGVIFLKTNFIVFLLINAVMKMVIIGVQQDGEISNWTGNLILFVAAAAYTMTFSLTSLLLFGLGSSGSMVQLSGKFDSATQNATNKVGNVSAGVAGGIAGMAGAGAVGFGRGTLGGLQQATKDGLSGRARWAAAAQSGLGTAFVEGGQVIGSGLKRLPFVGDVLRESTNAWTEGKQRGARFQKQHQFLKERGEDGALGGMLPGVMGSAVKSSFMRSEIASQQKELGELTKTIMSSQRLQEKNPYGRQEGRVLDVLNKERESRTISSFKSANQAPETKGVSIDKDHKADSVLESVEGILRKAHLEIHRADLDQKGVSREGQVSMARGKSLEFLEESALRGANAEKPFKALIKGEKEVSKDSKNAYYWSGIHADTLESVVTENGENWGEVLRELKKTPGFKKEKRDGETYLMFKEFSYQSGSQVVNDGAIASNRIQGPRAQMAPAQEQPAAPRQTVSAGKPRFRPKRQIPDDDS